MCPIGLSHRPPGQGHSGAWKIGGVQALLLFHVQGSSSSHMSPALRMRSNRARVGTSGSGSGLPGAESLSDNPPQLAPCPFCDSNV